MNGIGPYLAGAAFWIFIGACCVTAIITDYKRRRDGVEVLRAAIDKGQQLDPAVIERLTSSDRRDEGIDPVLVKLGGIITLATVSASACCPSSSAASRPLRSIPSWAAEYW